MVYRVFVEKKETMAAEAAALLADLRLCLRVDGLTDVRIFQRYDVEGIDAARFADCVRTVLSEPPMDHVYDHLPAPEDGVLFAVEYLPGQFDQRADSAAQCMQIVTQGARPRVRTARVYWLRGQLSPADLAAIKGYLINPVECREAALAPCETLDERVPPPEPVATVSGLRDLDDPGLETLRATYGLAMDCADLSVCRAYFRAEGRDPTVTELRVIDTYWSDHCRHTTFLTALDEVTFDDGLAKQTFADYLSARDAAGRTGPVTLMDMGTIVGRLLRKQGKLPKLDQSEEVNACTVNIDVRTKDGVEPWLLFFKNETHNHPTEIEPFGGAATCLGGAIRDPLSGRAYVYAAMRLTGAADPRVPVAQTRAGKLPQRTIVTRAAAGYSAYGNQIGLATGQVDELYHPGYEAKRMEIGAVLGAAPAAHVRRAVPAAGDVVVLLGGKTGRDGCGGATGSSKAHTESSLETGGAEVQKGNPPEERKLQRLFRNRAVSLLIKRCNDFGAGGVAVAIGELADGLDIDLDAVPKKYAGLDGTELAISESQERMAVVVAAEDAPQLIALAAQENLDATVVARVTDDRRLTMRWGGRTIVSLSRDLLDTNGAQKHAAARVTAPLPFDKPPVGDFAAAYHALAGDLNVASKRGLAERFDATIGGGTVLMPFGGRHQRTPPQAMVHKITREAGDTTTCSVMAWGYNPFVAEQSPYHAGYLAVVESVCKLAATGAPLSETYLTFQEYFPRLGSDTARWGMPVAALLGAFRAQMELGVAAVGGKDSMSGSFEELDVPPTLVSFAVTTAEVADILSPEFKGTGHTVTWLRPTCGADGLPEAASLRATLDTVQRLARAGALCAAWTPGYGGVAQGILNMSLGNGIGLTFDAARTTDELFGYAYGSFLLEFGDAADAVGLPLGVTTQDAALVWRGQRLDLDALVQAHEGALEAVYPCNIAHAPRDIPAFTHTSPPRPRGALHTAQAEGLRGARPRVLIPVFPGTNCEYDTARAFRAAGAQPEVVVIRNRTAQDIAASIEEVAARLSGAQMLFLPGGFSGGDEPDGSAKLIVSFFRNPLLRQQVDALLQQRDGLICGICNGFQALVKLGLVPYGEIREPDAQSPTLTFNTIGRHQSRMVRTRVCSNRSPWLSETEPGEIYTVPISHGEGRFVAPEALIRSLAQRGQIATQYVDASGAPTWDVRFNPNDSDFAIEGLCSPDGRVFGKMGHSERVGDGLYRNLPGDYDMGLFRAAVRYFA